MWIGKWDQGNNQQPYFLNQIALQTSGRSLRYIEPYLTLSHAEIVLENPQDEPSSFPYSLSFQLDSCSLATFSSTSELLNYFQMWKKIVDLLCQNQTNSEEGQWFFKSNRFNIETELFILLSNNFFDSLFFMWKKKNYSLFVRIIGKIKQEIFICL